MSHLKIRKMQDTIAIKRDPRMDDKFGGYSKEVKSKLEYLRKLILETASEIDDIGVLEETLKWGEPSYLVKKGSTIRIDWKAKTPDQYAIYFKCTSKLVVTFRELYGDTFNYENNRAILFGFKDEVPVAPLKVCIGMALQYHKIKHLPLLGALI